MTLLELYNNLVVTAKKTRKREFLKEFFLQASPEDLQLLRMWLDPQFVTNFTNKSIIKAREVPLDTSLPELTIGELVQKLSDRVYTGKAAQSMYRATTEGKDQGFIELLDLLLLKAPLGVTSVSLNEVYNELYGKDFISIFECQLAETYDPCRKYTNTHWYASKKMDGIRCVFRDGRLYSRNNKTIDGFTEIEQSLKKISEDYNLTLIDGELFTTKISFHEIQGSVSRDSKTGNILLFNLFAVQKANPITTKEMLEIMAFIDKADYNRITVVENKWIENTQEAIEEEARRLVSLGFEGVMLRHPDISYCYGRSWDLVKFKFFKEDDFIIEECILGKGKHSKRLGKFKVRSTDGKIVSEVGSGIPDDIRDEVWSKPNDYIGMKIEVQYQELSPENDKGIRSLRFPVFLKFKTDR